MRKKVLTTFVLAILAALGWLWVISSDGLRLAEVHTRIEPPSAKAAAQPLPDVNRQRRGDHGIAARTDSLAARYPEYVGAEGAAKLKIHFNQHFIKAIPYLAGFEADTVAAHVLMKDLLARGVGGDEEAIIAASRLMYRCAGFLGDPRLLGEVKADGCSRVLPAQQKQTMELLAGSALAGNPYAKFQMLDMVAANFTGAQFATQLLHEPALLQSLQQATRDAIVYFEQYPYSPFLSNIAQAYRVGYVLPHDQVMAFAYTQADVALRASQGRLTNVDIVGMRHDASLRTAEERAAAASAAKEILSRCCPGVSLPNEVNKG